MAEVSKATGEERLKQAEADYASVDKMNVPAIDAVQARMQSARAMIAAAGAP